MPSVTVPASVKTVGDGCFEDCKALTSVSIPKTVKEIGDICFRNCTALPAIALPDSLKLLGWGAFNGCTSLTSIVIPDSVKVLDTCFGGCTSLASVTLPDSLKTIEVCCFQNCAFSSITLPDSLEIIGRSCFEDCKNLKSIRIPRAVQQIGGACFYHCESLDSIMVEKENAFYDSREGCNAIIETATNTLIAGCMKTNIPEGVETLAGNSFAGHTRLTSITLPASLTYIGESCFCDCTNLSDFHIRCLTPPEASSAWQGIFGWHCEALDTIYVPKGTKEKYENAYPWSFYKIVEEDTESGIMDVMANGKAMPVYHINGSRIGTTDDFNTLPQGIYIVGGKKVMR